MDMDEPVALGTARTADTPRFHNGMIWYREDGTNRLMAMPMDDPSKAFNPGGLKTLSEPVLVQNRYITFRGEHDEVMLVTTDAPHLHGRVGTASCLSAPVPNASYLYFQGPGNTLLRSHLHIDECTTLDSHTCAGRPAISEIAPDYVWYMSTLTRRSSIPRRIFGFDLKTMTAAKTMDVGETSGSILYVSPSNKWLWLICFGKLIPSFQGNIGHYPMLYALFPNADLIRPATAPYGTDAHSLIYYVHNRDLYCVNMAAEPQDANKELIARGCATSPDVGFGFVLYGGTDKRIYKAARSGMPL
jgi:hypothetical protein